jgi:hypothetical protein
MDCDKELDIINIIDKMDFSNIDYDYFYDHSTLLIDEIMYRCVFCSGVGVFNHWFPIKNEKEIFVKMFMALKKYIDNTSLTFKLIEDIDFDENYEVFKTCLYCKLIQQNSLLIFAFYTNDDDNMLF